MAKGSLIRVSSETKAELERRADGRPLGEVVRRLLTSAPDTAEATGEESLVVERPAPSRKRAPAAEVGPLPALTRAFDALEVRDPEAVCVRCRQPWRLHQSGRFGNRAELTGCTTFEVG